MPRMLHRYPELFQGLSWEVAFPCSAPDPSWKCFFSLLQDQNSAPDPTWKWIFPAPGPKLSSFQPSFPSPSPSMSIPKAGRGQREGILPSPPREKLGAQPSPGECSSPFQKENRDYREYPRLEFHGLAAPSRGEKKPRRVGMCSRCAAQLERDPRRGWTSGIPQEVQGEGSG